MALLVDTEQTGLETRPMNGALTGKGKAPTGK